MHLSVHDICRTFGQLVLGSALAGLLVFPSAQGAAATIQQRPNVAILVYDGVQVIDHAIPFEVFGQFSLNNVYTVAKDPGPITTYMGMRVIPNYSFDDAPPADVLVLPGGDHRNGILDDAEVMDWIRRSAESAEHVLTTCTGIFLLAGTDLLRNARVTTWYARQEELRGAAPGIEVLGDQLVVDDGKLVTAAGTGVEGALHVLAKLHGEAWAEVVRLNMEYEPVPESRRVPRVQLADLNLPDGIYAVVPWREAEFRSYDGDRDRWSMSWRFETDATIDGLRSDLAEAFTDVDGWSLEEEEESGDHWRSAWGLPGHDGRPWWGEVALVGRDREFTLTVEVRRKGSRSPRP